MKEISKALEELNTEMTATYAKLKKLEYQMQYISKLIEEELK